MLADLKPDTRALREFEKLFGRSAVHDLKGPVPWAWREKKALAPAHIEAVGNIVEIDAYDTLRHLERGHAEFLADHGIENLNISELRSKQREVTQHLARAMYDAGYAGVAFGSNENNRRCFALFEDRATLESAGDPIPMTEDHADLLEAAHRAGLRLEGR